MAEEDKKFFAWDNVSLEQLIERIKGAVENASYLTEPLEELCQGYGKEENVFGTAEAFMKDEFGPDGWFCNFVSVNESMMSKYQPVTQEDREKYAYWEDLKIISEMCKKAYIGYSKLNKELFKSCFIFIQAKVNMENKNLNKGLYEQLNGIIDGIADLIKTNPNSLSLPSYDKYLREYKELIEKAKASGKTEDEASRARGAIKIAYSEYLSTSDFGRLLTIDKELKRNRLPTNLYNQIGQIDLYTSALAKAAKQDLEKLKDSGKDFCDNGIEINTKMKEMLKNQLSRSLAETLSRITGVFFRYTSLGYEYYEKFKSSSDAPFCFMTKAPALKNATGVGLSPLSEFQSGDPWSTNGTRYNEIFEIMLGALLNYYYEVLEPARDPFR